VDRHAKKLEKKRKQRESSKKQARALDARRPDAKQTLIKLAAQQPFGACWISARGGMSEDVGLVSVIVTRQLSDGRLLPGVVLLEPSFRGVKSAFAAPAMQRAELEDWVRRMEASAGAMERCEPEVAQRLVFDAIDRARALGFEPDPDFPAPLFGPRPAALAAPQEIAVAADP